MLQRPVQQVRVRVEGVDHGGGEVPGRHTVADRCIGCGLCVSTCPSEALTLVRKAAAGQAEIPADISATWQTISQTQRP